MSARARCATAEDRSAALDVVVLARIYGGFVTPAQGAPVGVVLTLVPGLLNGGLTVRAIFESRIAAAGPTAMIVAIVFGTGLLNVALALGRMPIEVASCFATSDIPPMMVLLAMVVFHLVMGCLMDGLSSCGR